MELKKSSIFDGKSSEQKGNGYIKEWVVFIQNTKCRLRQLY